MPSALFPPVFPPSQTNKHQKKKTKTYLLPLPLTPRFRHPPQQLPHAQDPIDQQPVGRALDLEVPEESVGAVEGEDFVEGVVGLVVRVRGRFGRGCVRGEGWEGVGGAAGAGAKGGEGEVGLVGRVSKGGGGG